jgi:hypothetical protein
MIPEEVTESPPPQEPMAKSEGQQLSKQQIRAQKKLEKQKEKEEKRLKKIEQKKLRMEAREKEKETTRYIQEQAEVGPPHEAPSEEPVPVVEQPPKIKVDVSAFKDIESIDEHIGELLYRNGYFSLDDLRKATIDDLVHIRGIKRKLAKKIKKEVDQKIPLKPAEEFTPIKQKVRSKKLKEEHEDATEWQSFSVNNSEDVFTTTPATYGKYTLYKKERGKGEKKTTIHFFSKEKPATGTPAPLPEGCQIGVHKKTKVPYLKKKK